MLATASEVPKMQGWRMYGRDSFDFAQGRSAPTFLLFDTLRNRLL